MLPRNYYAYFYGTTAGAEIDLVITNAEKPVLGCEIKFSLSPVLGKSFWNAFKDLECEKAFVIYPGEEKYPLSEKVQAVPFNQLELLFKKTVVSEGSLS